ncbi:MAG: LytTR family transcriptional regulator [Lachnospiraceae bacterium]|nr:LytTR family transcriptional regulator [Lachnospiraceae bacterium]
MAIVKDILLNVMGGVKKIRIQQIYYIEGQNRMLHYHTDEGTFSVRGTMKSVVAELAKYPFAKCNHWYIVNLMHVTEIKKNIVVVGGHELEISRRNHASFIHALAEYIEGPDKEY